MSIGVVLQEAVIFPVIPNAGLLVLGDTGHISGYDIQAFAVRGDHQGMGTMLATTLHRRNDFRGAQFAVLQHLGPRQGIVAHHVEVVEGVEHAVQRRLNVKLLDLAFIEILSWNGNLYQEGPGPSLIRYRQATIAIKSHRYPGTILFLVHLVDQVHAEAGLHIETR